MFSILIVEDDPTTQIALAKLLANHFADANVESARSEEEALAALRSYGDAGMHLDVAVLDLLIPESEGEHARVSSLCAQLGEVQPETLVAHVTAYCTDERAREHFDSFHLKDIGNPAFLVDKTGKEWEDTLIRKLACHRIKRQMDKMDSPRLGRTSRAYGQAFRGETGVNAHLTNDISRFWKLLDDPLKERIQRRFKVVEDQNPILVGMGDNRASGDE